MWICASKISKNLKNWYRKSKIFQIIYKSPLFQGNQQFCQGKRIFHLSLNLSLLAYQAGFTGFSIFTSNAGRSGFLGLLPYRFL